MKKSLSKIGSLLSLPYGMGMMVAVQLSFPLISLIPWPIVQNDIATGQWLGVAFFTLIFWLIPFAIISTLAQRSKWVIPLFLTSCVLNLVYSYAYLPSGGSHSYEFLRWLMMGVILLGGCIILRIDHLIPLLVSNQRAFRRSPRSRTERLISIRAEDSPEGTALLKNISETGVCIAFFKDSEIKIPEDTESFTLELKVGKWRGQLPCIVMWKKILEDQVVFGLHVGATTKMKSLFHYSQSSTSSQGSLDFIAKSFHGTGLRKILVTIWGLASTLSVIVPSCGRTAAFEETASSNYVSVSFDQKALGLTGLSSTSIRVDDCLSGFQKSFDSTSIGEIQLTQGDKGCLAYLDSLNINSEIFTVAEGFSFSTSLGTLTPFTNSSGSLIHVLVTSQLPDLISGSPHIGFGIIQSSEGEAIEADGATLPSVNIAPGTTNITEDGGTLSFTITRVGPTYNDLLVNLNIAGSAENGVDYTTMNSTITIPKDQASVVIQTNIIDDLLVESAEQIAINIDIGPAYVVDPTIHFVTIQDNEETPLPNKEVFHLKPEDWSLSGANINQWNDSTGNNLHAAQSAGNRQPVPETEGSAPERVRFDGVDDFLVVPNDSRINSSSVTELVIGMALKTPLDINTRQVLWEQGGNTNGLSLIVDSGSLHATIYASTNVTHIEKAIQPDSHLNTLLHYSLTKGSFDLYFGSAKVATSPIQMTLPSHTGGCGLGGLNGGSKLWDGTKLNGNHTFKGAIKEVIYQNGILTDTELATINAHLQNSHPAPIVKSLLVSASQTTFTENSGESVQLTFSRDDSLSSEELTINLEVAGEATQDIDYSGLTTSVILEPGSTSESITISSIDDALLEDPESIIITITGSEDYLPTTSSINLTLRDDDKFTLPTDQLVMNFQASSGVTSDPTNGNTVSNWQSPTTNGLSFTQSSQNARPILSNNGTIDEILFDGIDDSFPSVSHASVNKATFSEKTILIGFRTGTDLVSQQVIYAQGGNTRGLNIYISNGQLVFGGWNKANDDQNATTPWGPFFNSDLTLSPQTEYFLIFELDAPNQEIRLALNGSPPATISGVGKLFSHNGAAIAHRGNSIVYQSGNADTTYGGAIYQVAHYNRLLSPSERVDIENHIQNTYQSIIWGGGP